MTLGAHGPVTVGQTQLPLRQTSFVQALPSEQVFVSSFVCTQPKTGSQASSVHGLPSSQATGVCVQPTPWPTCMRIVPVVLPDIPATWPPGLPTKSIR